MKEHIYNEIQIPLAKIFFFKLLNSKLTEFSKYISLNCLVLMIQKHFFKQMA